MQIIFPNVPITFIRKEERICAMKCDFTASESKQYLVGKDSYIWKEVVIDYGGIEKG